MSILNILSGGAAHGVVANLASAFKAGTGFDVKGEFGAVGAMADRLRSGVPADLIILTAALAARLAAEGLATAASIRDIAVGEGTLDKAPTSTMSQACGDSCSEATLLCTRVLQGPTTDLYMHGTGIWTPLTVRHRSSPRQYERRSDQGNKGPRERPPSGRRRS